MKLGEGKPENQNAAIIFCFNEALQAIDMNQVPRPGAPSGPVAAAAAPLPGLQNPRLSHAPPRSTAASAVIHAEARLLCMWAVFMAVQQHWRGAAGALSPSESGAVESNHASMLPQEIDDVVFHPGSLRQTPQRLRVDPPVSTAHLARLSSLLHAA